MTRPTLRLGSEGSDVVIVQVCLRARPIDGDFGTGTEDAVEGYQHRKHLKPVDGVVGKDTWAALEKDFNLPPYPAPLPPPLDDQTIDRIIEIAERSEIAGYSWDDRGDAPPGYINGMAVGFATVLVKLAARDSAAIEMAKAATNDPEHDALARFADTFRDLGMSNDEAGIDTLRHLFVLQLGLGMRESSGYHCEGRDQSATNIEADTCEAGLFQMSWNASGCSSEMQKLMDQYASGPPQCALDIFREGVSCGEEDWDCYGTGPGADYQALAKSCPQFAVETAAIGLRNLCMHWGPVQRYEVEIRPEADAMFRAVQAVLRGEQS